jgi:hypothetical protein
MGDKRIMLMMFILSLVVFMSVYVITIGDSLSSYFTIVKKDRWQSVLWGFISWILSAIVFLFILKSENPVIYILCGAIGGAVGNLSSIKVIRSYRSLLKKIKKIFRRGRRRKYGNKNRFLSL